MKKIININLSARLIPIEDTAYDMLKLYVESLKKYFDKEVGKEEIISDIESRIAELFQERLATGTHCITDEDVTRIIASIGKPEDLDAEENAGNYYYSESQQQAEGAGFKKEDRQEGFQQQGATAAHNTMEDVDDDHNKLFRNSNDSVIMGVCSGIAHKLKIDPTLVRILYILLTIGSFGISLLLYVVLSIFLPAAPLKPNLKKRLFRSPENRMIAGVCGGLANYLKVDIWLVRLAFSFTFLLQMLFALFSIGGKLYSVSAPNIIFGSFTFTFIVAYLVLWVLIPTPKTRSEKLQMKGKKVDLENIKNTVHEELNAKKDDITSKATYYSANFLQALGKIVKVVFMLICSVIIVGCLLFFIALLGFSWASIPFQSYIFEQQSDSILFWLTILLFLGIPVIAMVLWIIRRLIGAKSRIRYIGFVFFILWLVGLGSMLFLTFNTTNYFATKVNVEHIYPIEQPSNKSIIVYANDTDDNYNRNNRTRYNSSRLGYSNNYNVEVFNRWYSNSEFSLEEDSLVLRTIQMQVSRSKDSLFHLIGNKVSRGANTAAALESANAIQYDIKQTDSIIHLDKGVTIKRGEKYRMQQMVFNLQVPVGGKIMINSRNIHRIRYNSSSYTWNGIVTFNEEWDDDDYNSAFKNYRWIPYYEYIMTAKGLERVK